MYAENPKQLNKTYRIWIAHTEQEIDTIIYMGIFSGNKTGFVRLARSHIAYSHDKQHVLVLKLAQSKRAQ